eukprot:285727-Rhodomonas_salina.3
MHILKLGGKTLILVTYVDDCLLLYDNDSLLESFKEHIGCKFKYTKEGAELSWHISVKYNRDWEAGTVKLTQAAYIDELLWKFGMEKCNPMVEHTQLTRADCLRQLSLDLENLKMVAHYDTTRSWFHGERALLIPGKPWEGTHACCHPAETEVDLKGTLTWTGQAVKKLYAGAAVSWKCKRQLVVAFSTAEAEYIAVSKAAQEMIYLQWIQLDLGEEIVEGYVLHKDTKGCMDLGNHPSALDRTKHIDILVFFLLQAVADGHVWLVSCRTNEMTADMMTKALSGPAL